MSILFIALLFCPKSIHASTTTYTRVDFSESDPDNYFRSYYRWRNNERIPSVHDAGIDYDRIEWRSLEASEGIYDFSLIDDKIAQAQTNGQKFAFRLRDLTTSDAISVPDYLSNYGFWDQGLFIPDWNDPYYQERLRAFILAVGERYNGTNQIAFIDIGMYGKWGEWHVHGVNYPEGYEKPTADTLKFIIDAHLDAFPDEQLLIMAGENSTANTEANRYLYQERQPNLQVPVGIRNDCLGVISSSSSPTGYREHFRDMFTRPQWEYRTEVWKVAPIITEYCNTPTGSGGFLAAPEQVIDAHVTLLSNGNFSSWDTYTSEEQAAAYTAGAYAGYRISLESIDYPDIISPETPFDISISWSNYGVAPVYFPALVQINLIDDTGQTVGSVDSTYALRCPNIPSPTIADCLLPTYDHATFTNTPHTHTESITFAAIEPDSYTLSISVIQPDQMQEQMNLFNDKSLSPGVYEIGTVTVQGGSQCAEDINIDGIVDLRDYSMLVANFFSTEPDPIRADINADGIVDLRDYSLLVTSFFQTCP